MKALSIKQPWASLIAHGIKDIENRTWKTNFRGRIYIHASGQITKGLYSDFIPKKHWETLTEQQKNDTICFSQVTSAIIGEVDIVDCVMNHSSIWAEKTEGIIDINTNEFIPKSNPKPVYNWVLANAILYDKPILNVKGKLSFWKYTGCCVCRNPTTDELICRSCEYPVCENCTVRYTQHNQIDYTLCNNCK